MRITKKTAMLAFMVLILLGVSALAQADIVEKRLPTIKAEFDQSVTLINYNLTNSSGKSIGLEIVYRSLNEQLFKFKPEKELADGDYVFTIEAKSHDTDITNTTIKQFTVEIGALKITLVKPRFGYTTTLTVDVVIDANREAECKWQYIGTESFANMYDFTSSEGTTLTKKGITATTSGTDFYVKCNDTDTKQIVSKQFKIILDETPPNIHAGAYPNVIAEKVNGSYQTEIIARSLDEDKIVCKYDTITSNYSSMRYRFPGFDENNETSYKEVHRQEIKNLNDKTNHTYYVACKNLAGMVSNTERVEFRVDSDAPGQISIISPEESLITLNNSLFLEITTNRRADCSYGRNDSAIEKSGSFGTLGYWHLSNKVNFTDGRYTYYFKCKYTTEAQGIVSMTNSVSFIIDTTPPSKPIVNDTSPFKGIPEYSMYLDRLYGSWKSEDNLSGIKGYEYQILSLGNESTIIATGYTAEEHGWILDLSLVNGTKYYFSVKAENKAGLWSKNGTSEGVTIDTSKKPLNETANCNDGLRNQNETSIDCGGPCSGCKKGENCTKDKDCQSGLECKNKACSELDKCSNGKLDYGETDVDCGGVCALKEKLCEIGSACQYNDDCESGSCIQEKCTEMPSAECAAGQTKDCMIDECEGTRTCTEGSWGQCVKANPACGVEKKGLPQIVKLLLWLLILIILVIIGYFGWKYYEQYKEKKKPKAPPKIVPQPAFRPPTTIRPPTAIPRAPEAAGKKRTEDERKERVEELREKLRGERREIKESEREELFSAFRVPGKTGAEQEKEEKPEVKKGAAKKLAKTKEEDVFRKLRTETKKLKEATKKPLKK